MIRSALSLCTVLIVAAFTPAMTVSRPQVPSNFPERALATARRLQEVSLPERLAAKKDVTLEVTRTTEVKLDGRPCRYESVPATVEAVLIEVAEDGKTILKIHFRSQKR